MKETFLVDAGSYERIHRELEGRYDADATRRTALLSELCAYNRINALGVIYHAGRGWIGASLSCAEILTALYFDIARVKDDENGRDAIVLGKGHAAAMQYACLAGLGLIPVSSLLTYELPEGLQAHCDISTSGIEMNAGSMGQALSKCAGLAMASPNRRVFAILGDGELQEGQNFEAFATIHHRKLENLVVIVDRNRIQTDSNVDDIKSMHDMKAIFAGFGFNVRIAAGNDMASIHAAIVGAVNAKGPSVIIADTRKGAGISFMESNDARRRSYVWHSGVPSRMQYVEALKELSAHIVNSDLNSKIRRFIEDSGRAILSSPSSVKARIGVSTGEAFSREVVRLVAAHSEIRVFDADLERSCHLTEFAETYPDRFVEMGIAEQDMVSCAGGFALRGALPVVNTYASFFRRAYEQVYMNATERTKIIYAGHYAGLCYAPDGKSHQCTGDISMMRAIPGMTVFYPAFVEEIGGMLEWYLGDDSTGPLYMRLHRLPMGDCISLPSSPAFRMGEGRKVRDSGSSAAILTSGPHMTVNCARAADALKHDRGVSIDVYSVSTLSGLKIEFAKTLARSYRTLWVIEECFISGGLFDEVCRCLSRLKLKEWPRLFHKAVDDFTFSTLDPEGLYRHFGLDVEGICYSLRDSAI